MIPHYGFTPSLLLGSGLDVVWKSQRIRTIHFLPAYPVALCIQYAAFMPVRLLEVISTPYNFGFDRGLLRRL